MFNLTTLKILDYILIIAIATVFFFLANTYVRNQAIDGCAKSSSYTQSLVDQNASVTYPVTDMYEKCLQEKGIK
jgi:hypothetical protein